MELNYKINLRQKENLNVKENVKNISNVLTLSAFRYDGQYKIESNSSNISNYFKQTDTLVKNLNTKDNFIVGYEPLKEESNTPPEALIIDRMFLDNLLISEYSKNLYPIENFKFNKKIYPEDRIELISLIENTFDLIPEENYDLNYKNSEVVSESLDVGANYFILVLRNNFEYERTSKSFSLLEEDLIDIPSGFYEILPQFVKESSLIYWHQNLNNINIESEDVLKLSSDLYINYDNCISNNFTVFPQIPLTLSYNSNEYTPLNDIQEFKPDVEYFIFELENTMLVLKYFLSTEVESSGDLLGTYEVLMQSHEEFKKPFLVLGSKVEITILNEKTNTTELKTVYNNDFQAIKEDSDLINTLTKIKI